MKLNNEDKSSLKIWPEKVDAPDVGTYDVYNSATFIKKKYPKYSMGKAKAIKFTEEISNNKKFMPGIGHY